MALQAWSLVSFKILDFSRLHAHEMPETRSKNRIVQFGAVEIYTK